MSGSKKELPKRELEHQLQEALEQTFPASDPVTVGQPTSDAPDRPMHRRAPKLNVALVNDLARKAKRASNTPR